MPCTIRDASIVTVRNRNKALNSYYNDWKNKTVLSTAANSATTPPASTSAEVVAEIRLGCQACLAVSNNTNKIFGLAYDANISLYPENPSSANNNTNEN